MESSTRRWSGYVCPACRFVFRVPRDHEGAGILCPSCRRVLKLPVAGEVLPPLVTELASRREMPVEVNPPETSRRRRRAVKEDDDLTWEHRGNKESDQGSGVWLTAGIIGGAVVLSVGIILFFLRPPQDGPQAAVEPPAVVTEVPPSAVPSVPAEVASGPDILRFLDEVEPLAKAFLEAKTVEALTPLVRHPEITGPRIRSRFPSGKVEAPGLESFAKDRDASFEGDVARVNVRTSDFKDLILTFVKVGGSWKVDWESWTGWSEVTWDQLLSQKPVTPQRFRVKLVPMTYYNFGFTDELKWKSFGLLSPDGDHQIFGYVENASEADRKIQLQDAPKGREMLLDLKFPPGSTSRNQVIIDKVVAEGWFDPETDKR